ncbi:MAG: ribosome-binding factor A [Anaerolineae bacterium]
MTRTRPEALVALRHASGLLRRELGKRTLLRYVPELAFHFDSGLIQSQHMSDLLDDLSSQEVSS